MVAWHNDNMANVVRPEYIHTKHTNTIQNVNVKMNVNYILNFAVKYKQQKNINQKLNSISHLCEYDRVEGTEIKKSQIDFIFTGVC